MALSADDYAFDIQPLKGRVSAVVGGVTVGSTQRALLLTETRLPPVYYFPPEDVRTDLLMPSPRRTYCPIRGTASYWTVNAGGHVRRDAAWSYEQPLHDARRIRSYIAFDPEALDALVVDATQPLTPAASSYPNPLVDWILLRAPQASSIIELIEQFTEAAARASIPLWRVWLSVRTLHPQLFSTSYTWQRPEEGDDGPTGGIVERTIHHGLLEEDRYLDSPLRPIFEGAGGVRQRLEGDHPDLDYPIVRDHWRAGATDYVAMPIVFSDGQINVLSLTTKEPGGFTTRALGFIYEILAIFARLLEVHAARRKAVSLLQTYLGRQTGERVLNGLVKRGDRSRIHAVIWFCDLRDSSGLAERLTSDEYLDTLNEFYDCLAQPVLESGGEVLRFIGDAVLAIFALESHGAAPAPVTASACAHALAAARAARRRMDAANAAREAQGRAALGFGIGLHVGELTYGNIGTGDRLEFTVIGPAANVAARLQDLTKTVGRSVLISESFLRASGTAPADFEPVGHHELRGISARMAVYALR